MEGNWNAYANAVGSQAHPKCTEPGAVKYKSSDDKSDWWTGFQGLTPPNPELQAKYDAMSATWLGVSPTNQALVNGLFTSQPTPVDKTLPERK
jgi:hypothetical protein